MLIGRLVDGKMPRYPVTITDDTELDAVYLSEFIRLRASPGTDSTSATMRSDLVQLAHETRTYASDVLRGDFSVFPALDRQVKARL